MQVAKSSDKHWVGLLLLGIQIFIVICEIARTYSICKYIDNY